MNENAKKWVKALRSGEYRQTKARLRRGGQSRCCLGVACDVYAATHPTADWEKWRFLGTGDTLPEEVQKWLGLTTPTGGFNAHEKGWRTLASLNDYTNIGFEGIASFIESEPKGLFS